MLTATESRGLALARGFIVLIMPAVHTVLMYSSDSVKAGWPGTILGFLAEQPGAQLFMLQMGLFIGIGKQKTFKSILKRFAILFASGYLLNFARLVLPYAWGGIPGSFLVHNKIPGNVHTALYLLLVGDILQFAALGYLCCQIIYRLGKSVYFKIALLAALTLLAPFTWKIQPDNEMFQFISGLFNGIPPKAFFPFFPWICYPLAGLIIAQGIRQYHGGFKIRLWLAVSALLLVTGIAISSIEPAEWNNNFYRLGLGGTIFHLGAAIMWLVMFIFLSKNIKPNVFFSFLEGLSFRITLIYLLQWIIVIWLIPLFGFNTLGLKLSLIAITANSLLTFSLACFLPLCLKPWQHRIPGK